MATDEALASLLAMCRAANEARKQAIAPPFEPECRCRLKTASTEQMEQFEQVIKQQRIECEKGGWRPAAKWLEQNCEEYRQPCNGEVSNWEFPHYYHAGAIRFELIHLDRPHFATAAPLVSDARGIGAMQFPPRRDSQ